MTTSVIRAKPAGELFRSVPDTTINELCNVNDLLSVKTEVYNPIQTINDSFSRHS